MIKSVADQNVFKGCFFALIYFLMFLGEFVVYFITYSEAIVCDGYYNLLVSSLWVMNVCSKLTSSNSKSRKSTFGWSRLEGFSQLFITTFASALFFSVTVNSIQKMFSADRKFFLHYEVYLVVFGITGFLIHLATYAISGTDVKIHYDSETKRRQCLVSFTDYFEKFIPSFASSILLLLCALINLAAKGLIRIGMIDGLTALITVCMQLGPIGKMYHESGKILLQCIPNNFNLTLVENQLAKEFPELVNVHELHIWQLKEREIVLTCHLVVNPKSFKNGLDLRNRMLEVREFFKNHGASDITIQLEYQKEKAEQRSCLLSCPSFKTCSHKLCCIQQPLTI